MFVKSFFQDYLFLAMFFMGGVVVWYGNLLLLIRLIHHRLDERCLRLREGGTHAEVII